MNTSTIFELLHETGKAITSEIELGKVVQRVTDIGTELTGAQFGAFFYNTINPEGEILVLYTISGVAKEAFSKFPMPRNTKIFEPTFSARGTVRYDDVTQEPHYGQNPPYEGMPKGHLPVRSYLAVPVVSAVTGEAIGGLFFGHSQPGIFTEEHEKLIEGVAIQAAIAMTNAHLFEEKKQAEKKLREQREQYQSIFNATSDSIMIYDEKGYVVEANPSACRIFGYAYDELLGLHGSQLFRNPADFEGLKAIALSGRTYSGNTTRLRKDGTPIEVSFVASYFLFKGRPHVLSAVKDISSGKKVEEALHRHQEFTELISNVSPVTLWMTNEEGKTIFINQTWLDWVGGERTEHLDAGWQSAVVPEDRPAAATAFREAFAGRRVFTIDFRIRRRTGEVRWVSAHGSPYYRSDGAFGGFAGSLTDIHERKEAEGKLASQNVLINTITNNTGQALFLMDARQVCTYMNPAAEAMTGFRLEEVRDKPLHYYVHHTHPDGRHFPIEECAIDRALPTQMQTRGEEVFVHKDGHFYPVAFIASPIIEHGQPIGTVIEVRETTEEKRIQQELRIQEQKAMMLLEDKVRERTAELEKSNYELLQFTSVASHDLKEPVRKISVFARMLQDRLPAALDEPGQRYLGNIITSSERMARLIDDLLTFSRLNQGNLSFEPVSLPALVRQITEDLELSIQEKGAEILVGTLPVIEGIALQLGQVFQNLLVNSLKFAHPARRPVIRMDSERFEEQGQAWYRITYRDNGIGFRQEHAGKIFEVFQRLHSRDQYEGTGVGLAIVQKIISLHKGTITAEGKENEGAVFKMVLPERQ
ncbi:MAG TPA: PAS domain S-box protein [Chitinophagaceae bacterium]|nr:PAS domain S-box protein [Chitinophagaceae bacterium]